MTSVLEKVEILQAVGAEELADQALTKIMQIEIDRLKQEQQRLRAELTQFESTYHMTSDTCLQKFESGEGGDAVEFFEWTSIYTIYRRKEHTLRLLEEKLA